MIDVKGFVRDNNECRDKYIEKRKRSIMMTTFPVSLYDLIKHFGFGTYQTTMVATHYLVEEGLLIGLSPYSKDAPDDITNHILKSKAMEDVDA